MLQEMWVNSTRALVAQVLEVLQAGLDDSLAPNTLRRQVAALSSVLTFRSRDSLSHDPLICQFL